MILSVPNTWHPDPAPLPGRVQTNGLAAARRLVKEHGWNSTAHQVLDPGVKHWFSSAGDAVVGYVEAVGCRIVAGAPVAAEPRLASVTAEFEAASRRDGKQVWYFAAEERFIRALAGQRLTKHVVGYQPTWEAASWAQQFDAHASLRAQRNRAVNKGVEVHEEPAEAELSPALASCHADWLAGKGLPTLGFLAHSDATRADRLTLSDRRLFVATLAADTPADGADSALQGRAVAYLTTCPVPGRNGWLVDKVVRHPAAPNGTTELLLDTALRTLAVGAERFTLGLAPLASEPRGSEALQDDSPAWVSRLERLALEHGRSLYDFGGLYAFKKKFHPDAWEPVYLLSTGRPLTPRTFLAVAGAFLVN